MVIQTVKKTTKKFFINQKATKSIGYMTIKNPDNSNSKKVFN